MHALIRGLPVISHNMLVVYGRHVLDQPEEKRFGGFQWALELILECQLVCTQLVFNKLLRFFSQTIRLAFPYGALLGDGPDDVASDGELVERRLERASH